MNKKILIGIIVVIILIILGVVLMSGNGDQNISYDDYLNVTIPSTFETTEVNGLVQESYPENKTYVLTIVEEDNITASEIDGQWASIKDMMSSGDIAKQLGYSGITDYTIGNNKMYEATISNSTIIKEDLDLDAQKVRIVDVVVPNSEKVYGLYFLTNDTSVDLNNADIQSIINSTAAA